MTLKGFLKIFGGIAIILTLMPFVAMDYWWVRIFDFPHTQLTLLTLVAFLVYFFRFDLRSWRDYLFALILAGCFVFQLLRIYPYTPMAEYEAGNSEAVDPDNTLSLLISNVLQKNKRTDALLREVIRRNPDVIVLTETDNRWRDKLRSNLQDRYPYRVEIPLDNTYGMLLYSQLELIDPEVKYLIADSIPSIHARVRLPSENEVQIHSIHPTPPMPQHNPSSADRDAEMMTVANMAREARLPVIVTGDFNDVAWSQTTALFQNVSRLLDPRVGRGFFNTYNANSWIMRWPLDHLFVSEEFRVLEMLRGHDIGSDHFPLYVKLSLEPEASHEQSPDEPSEGELERAKQQLEDEEQENR